MKKLKCPKCDSPNLFLMNEKGERLPIYVTFDFEIVPVHQDSAIDGFDTETIYCFGCSWSGSIRRLVK